MNRDTTGARRLRRNPPSHRPPPSPPTMTNVPLGVRARRSCDSVRRPPVSTMTSHCRAPSVRSRLRRVLLLGLVPLLAVGVASASPAPPAAEQALELTLPPPTGHD